MFTRIINKANDIDLKKRIEGLEPPVVKDELYRLTEALNRMLSRIDRQAREQNAFFASASHELRTPLSNMLTQLQVLRAQADLPLQALLENQVEEIRRLGRVVDNFLLMGQLNAGSVQAVSNVIDLLDLCINSLERSGLAGAVRLNVQPEDASFFVLADKHHVQMILDNVLRNTANYHQPSTKEHASLVKRDDGTFFMITNTTAHPITDPGALATEFTRRGAGGEGAGLGLWISKQLAVLNGIDLVITARENIFELLLIFPPQEI